MYVITLASKIEGIQRVAYLISSWFKGNITMSPSPYEGFAEGSLFITKVGGFDCGFYLS